MQIHRLVHTVKTLTNPLHRSTASRLMSTIPSTPESQRIIQEGSAYVLFPTDKVFYNNVQVLNRDLSIAIISDFARTRARERLHTTKSPHSHTPDPANLIAPSDEEIDAELGRSAAETGIKILEALSASGLRSIRYFQQIPGVKNILVNDLDPCAVNSIRQNIEYNALSTEQLIPNQADAADVLYAHRKETDQFDVIDLDPYGSASMLFDGAVQAIRNGGLLCITCTDLAVLCGNNPEVCFARYRAVPGKAQYVHENAIRIVLQAVEQSANRYQRHIVPVTSCCIDFYVRIFIRVFQSPANANKALSKISNVYQCVGCETFHLQSLGVENGKRFQAPRGPIVSKECEQCDSKFRLTGPIWSGPLHDRDAVLRIRSQVEKTETGKYPTKERLYGLLTAISEEVVDAPLHYTLSGLAKTLHSTNPRLDQFQSAIWAQGFQVSQFHKNPTAIKTDAPPQVVWDVMRRWIEQFPIHGKWHDQNTPGNRILAKPPQIEVNFQVKRPNKYMKEKAMRFPKNPEPNWGPKSRANSSRTPSNGDQEQLKRCKHSA